MSLPYAKPKWLDGNYQIATPINLPVFSSPIPSTTTEYLMRQEYQQFKNNFTPLALSTAHPDYPTFLLVEETDKKDLGGGIIQWTRVFAAVPATHYETESFTYPFIGVLNLLPGGVLITRTRKAWTVKSRIQYDYFLAPSTVTDPILGTLITITTFNDIPQILDMQYVFQATVGGALYGGITMATDLLQFASSSTPTWPSSDQYLANFVGDALVNGWNGTIAKIVTFKTSTFSGGPPPTSGHMQGTIDTLNSVMGGIIPAEPSRLTRWQGNIFQRATRYVLAQ